MREKKEFHRNNLPHFQQPGQAYFVTWNLKDAIPAKAFEDYTFQLIQLEHQIRVLKKENAVDSVIFNLEKEHQHVRNKYLKAYNDMLDAESHPSVNLSKPANTAILINTLQFWEGKKLNNHAFTIMNNHVHWVFELLKKDRNGKVVYLQDILQSVKRESANRINKNEGRQGSLWQKESFDTTIRDHKHLYNAINYTLNNPVKAGLISNWHQWPGSYRSGDFGSGDFGSGDF